ncbi:MAG: hypothetical protein IKH25_03635 [Muribaculaceae bacterium]|nr:hypothetical protein [Muribaculaceae bacterium]
MKQLSQQQAGTLLDRYMDGLTTLEEEAALRRYFRDHDDIPDEWQDYKVMFSYLDSGMEEGNLPAQEPQRTPFIAQMGRRWWGIAAAACITAAIVATAVLHQPKSPTLPETPAVTAQVDDDTAPAPPPAVETVPQQLATTAPTCPVGRGSASATRQASRTRRLQAENAKLARENERLQRELADLKRRAFIIDLEANGFRAVQDEDGSIVLIDIEQELENELNNHLNNQPTTNIPAL